MRNIELESSIKNILKDVYSTDVIDWDIRCHESVQGENNAARITADEGTVGDLIYFREIIDKLIKTNSSLKNDFKYFTMYDQWGDCRCGEEDKKWILRITIVTEEALKFFKEAIKNELKPKNLSKQRKSDIEKKLNILYNKEFEFTEPYKGAKGKHPAEIYSTSGVEKIIELFKELNLEKDIITHDCDAGKGLIQIIITTDMAVEAFKKAIDEKLIKNLYTFFKSNKHKENAEKNDLGFVSQMHSDKQKNTF